MRKMSVIALAIWGTPLYGTGFVGVGHTNNWRTYVAPSLDSGAVVCAGYRVFKVNPSGSVAWARSLSNYCEGVFTYPSGYVVVDGYGSDVHIHSLAGDGSEQWGYSYTLPGLYNNVREMVPSGGNLIFLFESYLSSVYYPLLLSLTTGGNVAWAKSYSVPGLVNTFVPYGGGYVIGLLDTTYNRDLVLIKTDASGNVSLAKTMGAYASTSGNFTIGMAVVGGNLFVSSDYNLLKLDSSLNVLWAKREGTYYLARIEAGEGANLYMAGDWDEIFKVDTSGNVIWSKEYASPLDISFHGMVLSGGRLYAVGDAGAYTDSIAVVSVGTDGSLPCASHYNLSFVSSSAALSNITVSVQSRSVSRGSSVSTGLASYTLNLQCVATDVGEVSGNFCGSGGEIYDASGRRYGKLPDKPGVYFIRTPKGTRKVIRR